MKKFFKIIFFIVLILVIVGVIFIYWQIKKDYFPQAQDPKKITLKCRYKNQDFVLEKTLYGSIYHYYQNKKAKHRFRLLGSDEKDFYQHFLFEHQSDSTLSEIIQEIKQLAQKNNFTKDQTLELTVAFIQNIPYDSSRAEEIKAKIGLENNLANQILPRYPYETLFENQGICTDKTILAAALVKKLDYGISFFLFEAQASRPGHLGLGIKCPQKYSLNNTGFCYCELSSPVRIGTTSGLTLEEGKVKREQLKSYKEHEARQETLDFKNARLYKIQDGIFYRGIIQTKKVTQKINQTYGDIQKIRSQLERLKIEIEDLKRKLAVYPQTLPSEVYYKEYFPLYSQYKDKINQYNSLVYRHNNLVSQYNELIQGFDTYSEKDEESWIFEPKNVFSFEFLNFY